MTTRRLSAVLAAGFAMVLAACGPTGAGSEDGGGNNNVIDAPPGGCTGGTVNCNGECVDTNIDSRYCGSCINACTAPDICSNATCQEDTCTEASSAAQSGVLPADIIIVVDNSGSMTDEAASVQASMNDFVTAITTSAIDARVIMISADSSDSQGVCVPVPMGSGACPNDENLPDFRHVVTTVASSNALQLILDTYDQWKDSLRANATKTIAVISDDNSSLGATSFSDQLIALDPSFTGFKFDAIIAPYDLNGLVCFPCVNTGNCQTCDPCCGSDSALGLLCTPLPADEGTVYKELVSATGGVEGNLCTQDFLPAFQDMATAVINDAQVACLYDIPDPGGGMVIDYNRVNVEFLPTPMGSPEIIPQIPGGAADCGPGGGWYYGDEMPPQQILLCPATCATVQAAAEAEITIKFGCTTIVG